jgi:thiosulfate dehydrogenase [quinone] large subunit
MSKKLLPTLWAVLRILLGWIFLWAFIDKTFGLGFTTAAENAWVNGVSPTGGYLANAAHGPLAGLFHAMAGSAVVDWLFMLGLLLIGLSLILGIATRIACASGAILLLLMFLSAMPPEHNPFIDEHIIYAIILVMIPFARADERLGLADQWKKLGIVKKFPILQ